MSEQLARVPAPSSANLEAKNDEAAATARGHELRVAAPFAGFGMLNRLAGMGCGAGVGLACPGEWTDASGINCQLLAMVGLQPVCHDFNAAAIHDGGINIHVREGHIPSDPATRFAANTCNCLFERRGPRCQHARSGTRRSMVTQWVESPAAGTAVGGERQWHAQPAEKCDPEVLARELEFQAGGQRSESSAGVAACLRMQQGLRRWGQGGKERLGRAFISRLASAPLPATEEFTRVGVTVGYMGTGPQIFPSGGIKPCGPEVGDCLQCAPACSRFRLSQQLQEPFGHERCSERDRWEGVTPGGPVGSETLVHGRSKAEAAMGCREPRDGDCFGGEGLGITCEQCGQARLDGRVVPRRIRFDQVWLDHAEVVNATGVGAEMQQEPGTLQIRHQRDSVQEQRLAF